jgi:hypothetical protein
MRRWRARPAGSAASASRVAEADNAVMVKDTAPSRCSSMRKASSPRSGCPGKVAVGESTPVWFDEQHDGPWFGRGRRRRHPKARPQVRLPAGQGMCRVGEHLGLGL